MSLLIQHYLQLGGKLNIKDAEGSSVLHYAAKGGNIESVQYLLRSRISADTMNRSMETPLIYLLKTVRHPAFGTIESEPRAMPKTSELNQMAVVILLVTADADVKLHDMQGKCAADYAKLYSEQMSNLIELLGSMNGP